MLLKKIFQIPYYLIPLIILVFIIILRPFILIRLYGINSNRIGHFIGNTEVYLTRKKANLFQPSRSYYDICFYYNSTQNLEKICNKQFDKMIRRVLTIFPTYPFHFTKKLIDKSSRYLNFISDHSVYITDHDRDINNLFSKFSPSFYFTEKEKRLGKNILKDMGIPSNAEFICFAIRDKTYLKNNFKDIDFSYHDYRDCNIDNFLLAAETLANKGYYVLRMGKIVSAKLSTNNLKIIDYANSEFRSDFMDIYLGAHCKFILTTQTGFDAIPYVFRKPAAAISVPVGLIRSFKFDNISITKHHYNERTNKKLSMKEIFDFNLGFSLKTEEFNKKDIKLIENSNIEINDLTIDMLTELEKPKEMQFILSEKQKQCNKILNYNIKKYKKEYQNGELLGSFTNSFLDNNSEFLE